MTDRMNNATKFRMLCIVLLWVALCYLLVTSGPFTLKTMFVIIASGIVVFVPLYKKHIRARIIPTKSTTKAMVELNESDYPVFSKVKYPSDIRKLDIGGLKQLCADMRKFLIRELSHNPGHFASSMGAMELTVALHYVFDTPNDRIVWDVGHQAYPHKLLTGRAAQFDTNRRLGGLSGFPNPAESEYDTFTAGHASNSISAALGMAVASALKHEPRRHVVAVIGDASIGGGLAFEGSTTQPIPRATCL